MSNVYVIRCKWRADGETNVKYLAVGNDDSQTTDDKQQARKFSSLLAADSYAVTLDCEFQGYTHIVEVL